MKVSINKRNTGNGKITLSIKIYWGYAKDPMTNKVKHHREYIPLDLYLYDNPSKGSP